jgi:hypothetical protein
MAFYAVHECFPSYGGLWYNAHVPVTAYLGVRFQLNGRAHYGWAKLTVEGASYAKLAGYAYETIAGKSIIAGQTQGAADDSGEEDFGSGTSLTNPIPDKPQPASLGMLALGAQGVPLWRRKESALEAWQALESEAAGATIGAPSDKTRSVVNRFFKDAEREIGNVTHEYFPKLLEVATIQRQHSGLHFSGCG